MEAHNNKAAMTTSTARPTLPGISNLRLTQDYASGLGVKKTLGTVPARKPNSQDFVRCHPEDAYRLQTYLLKLKEDGEFYLVDRPLWDELAGEITPWVLYTAINRQGVIFLWPVRLPGPDGRIDNWSASAYQAAEKAQTTWVRVQANKSLGAYEVYEATGAIPEPEWGEESFERLLEIAFRDRFIRTMDHPVVRRLRGLQ